MSTVITTTVLPDSTANDILTFGAAGDSLAISGDSLNLNTLQDAGGNTIFVSDGSGTITSSGNFPGAMKFISSQTVTTTATSVEFTGIDSTYDVYIFKFININPVSDQYSDFHFNASTDAGATYGVTKTSSAFWARFYESGAGGSLSYLAGGDEAQSTDPQILGSDTGQDADQNLCGELYIFAPSSTTYVKHFHSRTQSSSTDDQSQTFFMAGYFNTTSALDAFKFSFSVGDIDAAIIKLYGISKS